MIYFKTGISIILVAIALCSIVPIALAQDRQTSHVQTFSDPESGISFQYPSDWEVAPPDVINSFMENLKSDPLSKKISLAHVKPIVLIAPESMSGTSLNMVSEVLPFPMPVEIFTESNIRLLQEDSYYLEIGKSIPINLGNISGLKTTSNTVDGEITQINFVKGSRGYVITYSLGFYNPTEDTDDINMILNTLTIQ